MKNHLFTASLIVGLLSLVACGGGNNNPGTDAGTDTGPQITDSGFDADQDAGHDAGDPCVGAPVHGGTCYACAPTTDTQYLNRCYSASVDCEPFDNSRIPAP